MTLLIEVFTALECAVLARQCSALDGDLLMARQLVSGHAPVVLQVEAASASTQWRDAVGALVRDPSRPLLRLPAGNVTHAQADCGQGWLVERLGRAMQFHVYGTGLVARALVRLLIDLPFEVVWLDSEPANFPGEVSKRIRTITCPDLADAARRTRSGSFHVVMAATHELDLAVCVALLKAGTFTFLGVIGSRLKRQRLIEKLAGLGIPDTLLARMVCPVGLPDIRSKSPEVIAVSIAAQALIALQQPRLFTDNSMRDS